MPAGSRGASALALDFRARPVQPRAMDDAAESQDRGVDARASHARLEAELDRSLDPLLPALAARQRRYRLGGLAGVAATLLVLSGAVLTASYDLAAVSVLAVLGAFAVFEHLSRLYRDAVRGAVRPIVLRSIGGMTEGAGAGHEALDRLRSLPIVGPFSHHTLDDVFAGSHDGTEFVLAEIRLFNRTTRFSRTGMRRRRTTRESTVFKGLLFLIATPEPIPVRLLVRGPRIPWFASWRLSASRLARLGFVRVPVPDAAFSRHLSLWAEEAEAALRVIGPDLAATLARLAATAGWLRLDAGFSGRRFILLLPRGGDRFSIGGLFRPVGRLRAEAHRLMDEIMVVHRLIDVLKGRPA